jgi:hypothetical protein
MKSYEALSLRAMARKIGEGAANENRRTLTEARASRRFEHWKMQKNTRIFV